MSVHRCKWSHTGATSWQARRGAAGYTGTPEQAQSTLPGQDAGRAGQEEDQQSGARLFWRPGHLSHPQVAAGDL